MTYRGTVTDRPITIGDERLGEGVSACVFSGTFDGIPCAVKVTKSQAYHTAKPELVKKYLRREIEQTRNLILNNDFTGLVRIHDYHVVDDFKILFAMQLCESNLLQKLLEPTPIDFWSTAKKITEGVGNLHKRNIIHRDLKPANILTCGDEFFIADFGFTKDLSDSLAKSTIGTPLYVAPEVRSRKPYGLPADIYSLGCIFYELVTRQAYYHTKSFKSIIDNDIRSLIYQMTLDDPEKRPKIAEVMKYIEKQLGYITVFIDTRSIWNGVRVRREFWVKTVDIDASKIHGGLILNESGEPVNGRLSLDDITRHGVFTIIDPRPIIIDAADTNGFQKGLSSLVKYISKTAPPWQHFIIQSVIDTASSNSMPALMAGQVALLIKLLEPNLIPELDELRNKCQTQSQQLANLQSDYDKLKNELTNMTLARGDLILKNVELLKVKNEHELLKKKFDADQIAEAYRQVEQYKDHVERLDRENTELHALLTDRYSL